MSNVLMSEVWARFLESRYPRITDYDRETAYFRKISHEQGQRRFVSLGCRKDGDGSHDCAGCDCPERCHEQFAKALGLLRGR